MFEGYRMDIDLSFYEKIVDGWERTETVNGVPYFTNHKTERTAWDHPYWLKILEGLKDHDSVRYAAYRTALKIQHLQKQLHLHKVELFTIRNAFEDLGHTVGTWESLHCDDLLTLLVSVYRGHHGNQMYREEPEMLADVTLNLLLNLFDRNKTGFLKVMSVKIILVSLCAAKLPEKYKFFYQELHDPSTYISPRALHTFLTALMQLPELLHESSAFGRTSEPAVASCSQMGQEFGGITEDVFHRWLQQEPQTIVWLHTFHRIVSTESVKHEAKCKICKTNPIVGLRYKCLKCFNFDLCQTCFFTGKTKKRHKTKHPMQEYCLNVTAKENTAAFVKTLKNNLSRKHSHKSRLKYLPVEADSQYTNPAWSPGKDSLDGDSPSDDPEIESKPPDLEPGVEQLGTPVIQRAVPDYVVGQVTAKENTAAFVKTLKNNLSRKHSHKSRLKYLPVEADSQYTNPAWSPGKDSLDGDSPSDDPEIESKPPDLEPGVEQLGTPVIQRAVPDYVVGQEKLLDLSPKNDGLQAERDELNGIIKQLEAENRALYEQLCLLQDGSEAESSVCQGSATEGHSPNTVQYKGTGTTHNREGHAATHNREVHAATHRSQGHRALKEPRSLHAREPLPSEATPVYLSVPSIQVNGNNPGSASRSPRSPRCTSVSPQSAFHPPMTSSPRSPPQVYSRMYPPGYRESTLGVSVDCSPPKFSLPSPARSQSEFQFEEAELEALVTKASSMFPSHLSFTVDPVKRLSGEENEMLLAASSVGVAMSHLVNKAVNIQLPE